MIDQIPTECWLATHKLEHSLTSNPETVCIFQAMVVTTGSELLIPPLLTPDTSTTASAMTVPIIQSLFFMIPPQSLIETTSLACIALLETIIL